MLENKKIIKKISDYFEMDIKATRLNHYNDSNEWKPFHHDAAAVKKDKDVKQRIRRDRKRVKQLEGKLSATKQRLRDKEKVFKKFMVEIVIY